MTAAIELDALSEHDGPTVGVDALDPRVEPGEVDRLLARRDLAP